MDADALATGDTPDGAQNLSLTPGISGAAPGNCHPTRTPNPPVDSDQDRIPDDVVWTFNCVVSRPLETLTTTGTIEVSDPTPSAADFSAKHVFTNFFRSRTGTVNGKTRSVNRNGTRNRSGDTSALDFSETDFRADWVFENGSTGTHTKSWTSHFQADTPGSIQWDSLPSGTRTITGSSSWVRGDITRSLAVTTTTPLHYSADCTDVPRFDAGVLALVVTDKEGKTANVTVTFGPACGQVNVVK